jgi:hypothetical protein
MATQFDYRGAYKSATDPTSFVSLGDLKRLHADLVDPSRTAAEQCANAFMRPDNQIRRTIRGGEKGTQ